MVAPTIFPGRAFQGTQKTSDLAFHWRAADLSLTALTGQAGVFTRASSAGYVVGTGSRQWLDPDNQLRLVGPSSDGTPSWEYVQNASGVYVPALTLSGALTNLISSDDIKNDWTAVAGPVVTDSISDPAGGTLAFNVEDNGGASIEYVWLAISFTDDATKAVTFVVREGTMATSGIQELVLWDDIAGANRLVLEISAYVDGNPTVAATTGTLLSKVEVGNGYWALTGDAPTVDASHTHMAIIRPAATAAATGTIDVFKVNAFNSVVPCPKILAASTTHSTDTLYWPFALKPAAMTVYGRVENWANAQASVTVFHIGSATAAADARLQLDITAAGALQARYDDGTTDATTSALTAPTDGVGLEYVVTVTSVGVVGLSISQDGGALTTATTGAGGTPPNSWAAERLYMNSAGSTLQGFGSHAALKVMRGVRSMAFAREAF